MNIGGNNEIICLLIRTIHGRGKAGKPRTGSRKASRGNASIPHLIKENTLLIEEACKPPAGCRLVERHDLLNAAGMAPAAELGCDERIEDGLVFRKLDETAR